MKIKTSGICFFCATIIFMFLPINFYGIWRIVFGYYYLDIFSLLPRSHDFLEGIFVFILPLLHLVGTTSFFLKKWSTYSICLSGIIAWHLGMYFTFFSHPTITLMISTILFVIARFAISLSIKGVADDSQ